MLEYIDQLERRRQEKKGISWGFRDMDRTIGMMMPGRVYYCGARTGVCKSALALTTVRNVARTGVPVYMASMEMSREQIADRQVSMEASIDGHLLQHGFLRDSDWSNVVRATNSLSNLLIATDDERQTTSSLFLKVRQFRMDMLEKAKGLRERGKVQVAEAIERVNGVGLVVVDYFQLFKDPVGHMDKDQWTAHVSGAMVDLAKELQVPVLCLTQLNRESEKRGNKRPQLSDLRGGGAQEQDGWVVLLLHRPNEGVNDLVNVIVEKNRSGPIGTVQMKFHAEYTRFHSLERWVN
jgi:replicative DNA helicase